MWALQSNHLTSHDDSYSVHSTARKVSNRDGFPDHQNSDARTDRQFKIWMAQRYFPASTTKSTESRTDGEEVEPNSWLCSDERSKQTHEDMASTTCVEGNAAGTSPSCCLRQLEHWDAVTPTTIRHQTENVYHRSAELSALVRFKGALQSTTAHNATTGTT
jgi:hypothetical protein